MMIILLVKAFSLNVTIWVLGRKMLRVAVLAVLMLKGSFINIYTDMAVDKVGVVSLVKKPDWSVNSFDALF